MKVKLNKNNSIIIIVGVLLVSLVMNIYISVMNSKYKMKAGKESYRYIEEVKHRNESALIILEQGIEAKSISNEELLSLYKSYNSILDSMVQLGVSYNTYEDSYLIKLSSKDDKTYMKQNDVYKCIENLIYEYLNLEMKNAKAKLVLEDKVLSDFVKIKEVSVEVQDYLNKFNNEKLAHVKDEKREAKIIKKDYWMDMYLGVNETTQKYIDYPFNIGNYKNKNTLYKYLKSIYRAYFY
ncbi:MAG: hypothetical protein ACRDA5_07355 [Clostridium sp.]